MAVRTLTGLVSLRIVKASSRDTQPRIITTNPTPSSSSSSPANINSFPSFNTHIFKKRMISLNKNSQTQTKKPSSSSSSSSSSTKKKPSINVSKLLELNNPTIPKQEQEDEFYLGSERWLPSPPKANSPRSIYNAASLAYIGDCIYELYARRHFLFPALSIEECNDRVMAVKHRYVDALLKRLLGEDFLSEEERDLLRWGKNIDSGKTRTTKRAGVAVYNRASSFETLVGYLYLTNTKRLEEVMLKLGFTTAASNQLIREDVLKKPK